MKKMCVVLILIWLFIPFFCFASDMVNENSSATLTLTFRNEKGVAVTPTTIKYRIDDLSSGANITPVTSVTPSSSVYDVSIFSNENRIIAPARPYEQRRVTVQWYSGTTLVGTADYVYRVINLNKVPF